MPDPLRYPIGYFEHDGPASDQEVAAWTDEIEELPGRLRHTVSGLSDDQLDTPYRPGGWSIRQVIHHLPDSHLIAYTRFKIALTEDTPTVQDYDERSWSLLDDYKSTPVGDSLALLTHLHARWVVLMRSLTTEQLARRFVHPVRGEKPLSWFVGAYAWHGHHHLAHITRAIEREGWNTAASSEARAQPSEW